VSGINTLIDARCEAFEKAWRDHGAGRCERPPLEDICPEHDERLFEELLKIDVQYRARCGENPAAAEYQRRFPWMSAERIEHLLAALPTTPRASSTSRRSPPFPDVPGYEIQEELGRGGMGVVYKARQVKADRLVALKMILAGEHAGEGEVARFRIEAEAVARLSHPNIVQVYEVGEHEGRPFFSMEYCPGGSLERHLGGTPLPPPEAARLVQALAGAVQHAHAAGVVHRDLKPANVLLAEGGTPKVADFGLAKRLDEAGQTATGAVLGSLPYLAPEQASGWSKEAGPAADVYALGAILYECLTGQPPFIGATKEILLKQVLLNDPKAVRALNPQVPQALEDICLQCLEKVPRRRFASAAELADDLNRFLAREPVHARHIGLLGRAIRWSRRKPALAALSACLALALAAGGLVWWRSDRALEQKSNDLAVAKETAELEGLRHLAEIEFGKAQALRDEGDFRGAQLCLLRAVTFAKQARAGDLERQTLDQYGPWGRGAVAVRQVSASDMGADLISPDGRVLLRRAAEAGSDLEVWEAQPRRKRCTIRDGPRWEFWSGAVFGPGAEIARVPDSFDSGWWDLVRGRRLKLAGRGELSAAGLPGGQILLFGDEDGVVRLSDRDRPDEASVVCRLGGAVKHTVATPDGARVAFALESEGRGAAEVWDLRAAQGPRRLAHFDFRVRNYALALSPDGSLLFTDGPPADGDQHNRNGCLWDVSRGCLLGRLGRLEWEGEVTAACFTGDGRGVLIAVKKDMGSNYPSLRFAGHLRYWAAKICRPIGPALLAGDGITAVSEAEGRIVVGRQFDHSSVWSCPAFRRFGDLTPEEHAALQREAAQPGLLAR
jgi:tRNA A-37 threonylcarbamoyl transferase component Bud32